MARWALSYVLVNTVGWNYSRVGRLLNKDHATIRHGVRRAREKLREDEAFFDVVAMLEEEI